MISSGHLSIITVSSEKKVMAVKLNTHLHTVPRLNTSVSHLHSTIRLDVSVLSSAQIPTTLKHYTLLCERRISNNHRDSTFGIYHCLQYTAIHDVSGVASLWATVVTLLTVDVMFDFSRC
jgi:hypothetical protein